VAGFIYIYVGSRAAADNSYLFYLHEDGEKNPPFKGGANFLFVFDFIFFICF
jgi:hypothetical protein